MHLDCLPETTRSALKQAESVPAISKYVLIGGTAHASEPPKRLANRSWNMRRNRITFKKDETMSHNMATAGS